MDYEQQMINHLSKQIEKAEDDRVLTYRVVSSIVRIVREGRLEELPLIAARGELGSFAAQHILEHGLADFLEKHPEYARC